MNSNVQEDKNEFVVELEDLRLFFNMTTSFTIIGYVCDLSSFFSLNRNKSGQIPQKH